MSPQAVVRRRGLPELGELVLRVDGVHGGAGYRRDHVFLFQAVIF